MSRDFRFAIDLDGTLLDFLGGARQRAWDRFGFKLGPVTTFNVTQWGLPPEVATDLLECINPESVAVTRRLEAVDKSCRFYSSLNLLPGAAEALYLLRRYGTYMFVTARPHTMARESQQHLMRLLGPDLVSDTTHLLTTNAKARRCKDMGITHVFDDNVRECERYKCKRIVSYVIHSAYTAPYIQGFYLRPATSILDAAQKFVQDFVAGREVAV